MQKILEKLMKKYWKNANKTGKVREIRQSKKVGTMNRLGTVVAIAEKFNDWDQPSSKTFKCLMQIASAVQVVQCNIHSNVYGF